RRLAEFLKGQAQSATDCQTRKWNVDDVALGHVLTTSNNSIVVAHTDSLTCLGIWLLVPAFPLTWSRCVSTTRRRRQVGIRKATTISFRSDNQEVTAKAVAISAQGKIKDCCPNCCTRALCRTG